MKRVALFVGVDRYEDEAFRDLRYSVADAAALAAAFGRHRFETHVLTNPRTAELKKEVRQWTAGLRAGDVFLFFFAGHGYTGAGGEHLLICRDDDQVSLRHNRAGVPVDLLEELTNGRGCHRAFLLDACRTDLFSGQVERGDGQTRNLGLVKLPDAGKNPGTCCVLRSCDRFCPALEFENLGHGVFTQAVLDLLEGAAGTVVQMGEAFVDGVRERMRAILRREGSLAEQRPAFESNGPAFALFEEAERGTANRAEPSVGKPETRMAANAVTDFTGVVEMTEGGDLFLRKVRLEQNLEAAGADDMTNEERVALESIRNGYQHGARALRAGRDAEAEGRFSDVERALDEWQAALAERRAEQAANEQALERVRTLKAKLAAADQARGATARDRWALSRIRDVYVAGEEALKGGRQDVAEGLFADAERELTAWCEALIARRAARQGQLKHQVKCHIWRLCPVGAVLLLWPIPLFFFLRNGFDAAFGQTGAVWPWCWWHIKFDIGIGFLVGVALVVFASSSSRLEGLLDVDEGPFWGIVLGAVGLALAMWIGSVWHTFGVLGFAFRSFGVSLLLLVEYFIFSVVGLVAFHICDALLWQFDGNRGRADDGTTGIFDDDILDYGNPYKKRASSPEECALIWRNWEKERRIKHGIHPDQD